MKKKVLAWALIISVFFTLGDTMAFAAEDGSLPSEEEKVYMEEDLEPEEDSGTEEDYIITPFADSDSDVDEDEVEDPDSGTETGTGTVSVSGVSLSKTSLSMVVGQSATLTASVKPSDADNQNVKWSSNKTSVATVKNGKVTAVAQGTATITVTSDEDSSVTATCTVTVSKCTDGFHQDPDSSDWYYYTNGKVATGKTDVIKGTVNGTTAWWNVVKGKVTKGETVAKNSNGWWYINSSGRVNFSYTGFAENKNGWWYIEKGKVTFKKNSVIKDTNKKIDGKASWWYVVGSKVQTSYTGVADYKNEHGWWYIKNGKVDFSAETVAKNKNGWWYVKGGKVNFSANTVAENKNGWWYILGGKVQFNFTGLADYKNENGWWYIKKGKVDTSVTTIASNKNGTWYVKNGKVDFSYSGTVTLNGTKYTVTKGKVGVAVSSTMNKKAQSQSSSTKWLIVIDTSACRLGVFQGSKGNWAAIKYWKCSPGKPSTPTKKGKFTVQGKGKFFNGSSYTCWYYTQFYGNYLIHSVLYQKGSMTKIKSGTLGKQLSHGCVRLAIENAKWIYDNIPRGTRVYIY